MVQGTLGELIIEYRVVALWELRGAILMRKRQYTLFFFNKNKLYKSTQAEICWKIKNKLRTITMLKFWSEKFKKFI